MVMSIVCLNPGALRLLNRDMRQLGEDFSRNGGMRQPLIRSCREVLTPSIEQNFIEGGRPDRWPVLAEATLERRVGGGSVLMRSRRLFRAATAFARWSVSGNEARYGNLPSRAWYGIVHQSPEIAESAHIPVRPFVLIQEEDVDPIVKIFSEWVQERIDRRLRKVYV